MTQEVLVLEVDDPAITRLMEDLRRKIAKGKVPKKGAVKKAKGKSAAAYN